MAITLMKWLHQTPLCIWTDGTTAYVGTNKGKIYAVTVADNTTVVYATLANSRITAITSDGTYLYVGDDHGRLTRITIHGTYALRVKSVLESDLHTQILGIMHNTSTRYMVLANGKIAKK